MTKLKRLMHGALASEKRLIALCYALFFAASVLVCLASFAEDAFQRAVGNVVPAQLDVNGFRHLLPRGSWETFYDKIIHDKPTGVNRNMYNEHKVRPLL